MRVPGEMQKNSHIMVPSGRANVKGSFPPTAWKHRNRPVAKDLTAEAATVTRHAVRVPRPPPPGLRRSSLYPEVPVRRQTMTVVSSVRG